MADFLESATCRSRAACHTCRVAPEWRAAVGAPDECPYGVAVDSLPTVDRSLLLPAKTAKSGLGDMVSSALAAIGITKERVSALVGGPCGCDGRQSTMNAAGAWLGMPPGSTARPEIDPPA